MFKIFNICYILYIIFINLSDSFKIIINKLILIY